MLALFLLVSAAQRGRGCRVEFGEINFAFQQTMLSHVDRELGKAMLARDWIPETIFRPPPEGIVWYQICMWLRHRVEQDHQIIFAWHFWSLPLSIPVTLIREG